jgi:hypothetical protein
MRNNVAYARLNSAQHTQWNQEHTYTQPNRLHDTY